MGWETFFATKDCGIDSESHEAASLAAKGKSGGHSF